MEANLNTGGNVASMRLPASTSTRDARGLILGALKAVFPAAKLQGGTSRGFYRHANGGTELFQACMDRATTDAMRSVKGVLS